MKAYIAPKIRFQTHFSSLDEPIDQENPVRFMDAFVDKIELDKLLKSKLKVVLLLPKNILKTLFLWVRASMLNSEGKH